MNLPQRIDRSLDGCFSRLAPLEAGDSLLVAFSGGPDSVALLRALLRWGPGRGVSLYAAHLDHASDPGSADRAEASAAIARRFGIECVVERSAPAAGRTRPGGGRGPEEEARRARYAFLERTRNRLEARYVVTAHHRDDQVESVLLRILYGSGVVGLAGIAERRGRVVRPLLAYSRRELASTLGEDDPTPVDDPTNRDLARPRNLLRHHLIPYLERQEPELARRVVALALAAARARPPLEETLRRHLEAEGKGPLRPRVERLARLPDALWMPALALLHRAAGARYPPGAGAAAALRRAVERAIEQGRRVGCDAGGGWRWESSGERLTLTRSRLSGSASPEEGFVYTLEAPGAIDLPESGGRLVLDRQAVAPWMFRGSPTRAGLDLDLRGNRRIVVRSRRPGDRIRPLGCAHDRRLKEILIDRRVPRDRRSRLPLLLVDDRLVWVPGVTVDESCRIREGCREVWVAEWTKP